MLRHRSLVESEHDLGHIEAAIQVVSGISVALLGYSRNRDVGCSYRRFIREFVSLDPHIHSGFKTASVPPSYTSARQRETDRRLVGRNVEAD